MQTAASSSRRRTRSPRPGRWHSARHRPMPAGAPSRVRLMSRLPVDPRYRLDAAGDRAGHLRRRRPADLQRDARHRNGRRLVEADRLYRRRPGPDVGGHRDRLPLAAAPRVRAVCRCRWRCCWRRCVVGNKVFGSKRWIRVGGFHLQVSEFVKTGDNICWWPAT